MITKPSIFLYNYISTLEEESIFPQVKYNLIWIATMDEEIENIHNMHT